MSIFGDGEFGEIMGSLQDLSRLTVLYPHYAMSVLAASELGYPQDLAHFHFQACWHQLLVLLG